MGTVLLPSIGLLGRKPRASFQSPSRWGRCCFGRGGPPRTRFHRVSVPFSMGTVLLPCPSPTPQITTLSFQSPSRWGRCCFGTHPSKPDEHKPVSVPFSMGTVLLRNGYLAEDDAPAVSVSVPFSMGTVLLPWTKEQPTSFNTSFQSPSRWGRCCFPRGRRPAQRHLVVSVPFSMGTVLLRLLDGPTVQCFFGFSPLLDGDGVASDFRYLDTVAISAFQSPSRWGRCCFRFRTSTFYTTSSRASLPFSRRWRFCAETRSICEPRRHHTSPQ